jgi:hypothetical protein
MQVIKNFHDLLLWLASPLRLRIRSERSLSQQSTVNTKLIFSLRAPLCENSPLKAELVPKVQEKTAKRNVKSTPALFTLI